MNENKTTWTPLTLGDSYGKNQVMAMVNSITSTSINGNETLQTFQRYNWTMFLLFLQYQANLFEIEGDKILKRIWPAVCWWKLFVGRVAIIKVNDKLFVGSFYLDQENTDGSYYGKAFLMSNNMSSMGMATPNQSMMGNTPEDYSDNLKKKSKKDKEDTSTIPDKLSDNYLENEVIITNENSVLIKNHYFGLPFYYFYREFAFSYEKSVKAALTNLWLITKKFMFSVYNINPYALALEVDSITDPSNPFVAVVNEVKLVNNALREAKGTANRATLPNEIREIESRVSDVVEGFEALSAHEDWFFKFLGIASQGVKKKERNIQAEIENGNSFANIMTKEQKRYLLIALEEIKEKFGISAQLIEEELEEDVDASSDKNKSTEKPQGVKNDNSK